MFIGAFFLAAPANALDIPNLVGRVNDTASVLSPTVRATLEARLAAAEAKTGHQLVVLTVPTLDGEPIEDFSMKVVERWKLGHAKVDDGVLLLVVPGDRKARIEVGYGLEGALPDVSAGRIIRDDMTPFFRQGDYAGGIGAGVDSILQATGAEATPVTTKFTRAASKFASIIKFLFLFAFVLFFLLVSFIMKRLGFSSGSSHYRSGYSGGSFGSGHSSGGGSGGGGFSGGGGGSFGGGGASGSW